jgi:hypothetical protein
MDTDSIHKRKRSYDGIDSSRNDKFARSKRETENLLQIIKTRFHTNVYTMVDGIILDIYAWSPQSNPASDYAYLYRVIGSNQTDIRTLFLDCVIVFFFFLFYFLLTEPSNRHPSRFGSTEIVRCSSGQPHHQRSMPSR